jgi:hypothetical protein
MLLFRADVSIKVVVEDACLPRQEECETAPPGGGEVEGFLLSFAGRSLEEARA